MDGRDAFLKGLSQGAVLLDLSSRSVSDWVRALVEASPGLGSSAKLRSRAHKRVLQRESEASTAIGRGLAVPHALVPDLDQPVVALARLATPVNLGAPDGRPVHFVVLLLSPEKSSEMHLELLVAAARLFSDDDVVADLTFAQSPKEALTSVEGFFDVDAEPPPTRTDTGRFAADGLLPSGRFAGGLLGDLRRRRPHYLSDFLDGLHPKALAATLFLYFACIAPTVAFGGLMHQLTQGSIGVTEMIVSTAIGGVVYALSCGQPLTIIGGTGPLLVFTGVIYELCVSFNLPFLPFFSWVGFWTSGFCLAIALFDGSVFIRFCTRFTDEIFALLISAIFVSEALREMWRVFENPEVTPYTALVALVLAIGTFYLATSLKDFRRSVYLRPQIREFLADFGSIIAISVMIGVAVLFHRSDLPVLYVPDQLGTSSGRPWLVQLGALPVAAMIGASIPALLGTVLMYLDQNITTRLVNQADNKLRKGAAYHQDFVVISLLIAFNSFVGLPWLVAATVRSLNHLRALATYEVSVSRGQVHEHIVHVRETRLTGLGIHMLIGASVFVLPWLKGQGIEVPMSVLFGLFLFMGISSLSGNQFWERLKLWAKEPASYPQTHYVRRVPGRHVHSYTAVQLACLGVLWLVKVSTWALFFPLVIAVMVPIRLLLSRYYPPEVLDMLDSEEDPEEEMLREAGA
ncbi:MAG: PTS sugar transporter subunit IIA [Myxococcota bacterium]